MSICCMHSISHYVGFICSVNYCRVQGLNLTSKTWPRCSIQRKVKVHVAVFLLFLLSLPFNKILSFNKSTWPLSPSLVSSSIHCCSFHCHHLHRSYLWASQMLMSLICINALQTPRVTCIIDAQSPNNCSFPMEVKIRKNKQMPVVLLTHLCEAKNIFCMGLGWVLYDFFCAVYYLHSFYCMFFAAQLFDPDVKNIMFSINRSLPGWHVVSFYLSHFFLSASHIAFNTLCVHCYPYLLLHITCLCLSRHFIHNLAHLCSSFSSSPFICWEATVMNDMQTNLCRLCKRFQRLRIPDLFL